MFRLGSAAGVIGLGLQAAGMFGGGGGSTTQYVQDNRAKYEADMIGFQSTLDNQRWAEQILNGQIQAQTAIDDYSFNLQNLQLDKEMEMAEQSITQQYNASLFQNSLSRMNNEVNRYSQLTQYNQAKINADYQDAVTQRKLLLSQMSNQADLANSTNQNTINQVGLRMSDLGKDAETELQRRNLDLQESGLMDTETALGYKQQGLDLSNMELNQKLAEGNQTLDTQQAKGDITASINKSQAESERGNAIREMLRNVAKSEQEFSVYQTLLGANGRGGGGTQTKQVGYDQMLQSTQGQGAIQDQYAQGVGTADLQRSMNQQDVNLGRRNLGQQVGLARQGIRNQEGQLGLERNDVSRQRGAIQNQRSALEVQQSVDSASRELQLLGLQAQQGYDVFSKSILPDMQYLGEGLMSQWNRTNTNYSLDTQEQGNNLNYEMGNGILDMQNDSNLYSSLNGLDQVLANYNLQGNSAIASYLANMGNTQMQKASGLNQIAGNTFSQLGQYGGYSQPITGSTGGGGGFNPAGLSSFFDSAMSLLGNRGNSVSGNPYAYSGESIPSFSGGTVPEGSYSGGTMNGTINW